MKPFSQQESVMNAALNHYFHDHDETRKKVCLNSCLESLEILHKDNDGTRSNEPWLMAHELQQLQQLQQLCITAASVASSNTFQSGLTRKQKKIFALVKLMKKLNDRRSFFTAKIPVPEFETKPTPRPKNKDRGQI